MTIRFTCSECASVLKIKDELAGTSGRCPKCKTKFIVPAPQSDHERLPFGGDVHSDHPLTGSTDDAISGHGHVSDQILTEQSHDYEHTEKNESSDTGIPLAAGSPEMFRLDDSHDELKVSPDLSASSDVVHSSPEGDVVISDKENLDCPPMLVFVQLSQVKTAATPLQSHRSEKSSFAADKEFFSTRPTLPPPVIEPFDPSKFMVPDPPAAKREFASANDSDEIPELSLSDDSDIDLEDRPEQRPISKSVPAISRPTPAVSETRPQPEKMDLATAAKMMKKAIKDNQAAEAHQRDLDAKSGFDYGEVFREFGLKGLGILVGGVLLTFFLYFMADRMFGTKLHLPKMGYVSGVIKLNGQPLPGATIYFSPEEVQMDGTKRDRIRTSVGVADANGNFRMMYIPADRIEGVAVGRCRVWVDHIGPSGRSDVPTDWVEAAMQIKEVTPGRQKTPFEINMQSKTK